MRKITDYETRFRCGHGIGILREEVWVDERNRVQQYNLAFLLPQRFPADHGRVLGYDNAHGIHERHFMGEVKQVRFVSYAATAQRFFEEAARLRRQYEDEDFE